MPLIEWNDSYSVNIKELDEQHKKWIEIINNLHKALVSNNPDDMEKITAQSLDAMLEYILMHLAYEERHMEKIGFPELKEHRKKHQELIFMIQGYNIELKRGFLILNRELMDLLTDWLENHILNEDQKYAQYERNNDPSSQI